MTAYNLATAWQRILTPLTGHLHPARDGQAAIHRYDPIDDVRQWVRCRDRAQYHLGRARRAKDRGHYREAAREIKRALHYDDTNEAYFLVLAQCHLRATPSDRQAARAALERAFALNPRNRYTIHLLLDLLDSSGDRAAAYHLLERAAAAGAPLGPWRERLERERGPACCRVFS